MEVDGTDLYWPTNSLTQFRTFIFLHHTDIIVKACKELHRAGSVSNRVSTGYIRINDGSVHTVYYTVSHRTHEWQTHWFSSSIQFQTVSIPLLTLVMMHWARFLKFGPKCLFNRIKICHLGDFPTKFPADCEERFCDLRLLFWRGHEKLMLWHGSEAEV